jgi:hypothetical protein
MPKYRTESFGTGDQSWLGSVRGLTTARTETLNLSAFTPATTYYPNGYIPSGTPVARVGGLLVPYVAAEATTTGAGVLAGHLPVDVPVPAGSTANLPTAVLDHGRVKAARVPYAGGFAAPVAPAKSVNVSIVYI